jgi:hypothetical protein
MLTKLFGALPPFELGGRWRCKGDRDGEGDGDGEGDEGRRRYECTYIIGSIVSFLVCDVRRIGQAQFSLYKYIYKLYRTVLLSPVRLKYTSDSGLLE